MRSERCDQKHRSRPYHCWDPNGVIPSSPPTPRSLSWHVVGQLRQSFFSFCSPVALSSVPRRRCRCRRVLGAASPRHNSPSHRPKPRRQTTQQQRSRQRQRYGSPQRRTTWQRTTKDDGRQRTADDDGQPTAYSRQNRPTDQPMRGSSKKTNERTNDGSNVELVLVLVLVRSEH